MKPRILLSVVWYDCGHRYERWMCTDKNNIGRGSSPLNAYDDWLIRSFKA